MGNISYPTTTNKTNISKSNSPSPSTSYSNSPSSPSNSASSNSASSNSSYSSFFCKNFCSSCSNNSVSVTKKGGSGRKHGLNHSSSTRKRQRKFLSRKSRKR